MKIWTKIKDYFDLHSRVIEYRTEADGAYHKIVNLENENSGLKTIVEQMNFRIMSLRADIQALRIVLKEKSKRLAEIQTGRFRGTF